MFCDAEPAARLNDHALAEASLAGVRALPLTTEERDLIEDELAQMAELVSER